MNFDKKTYRYLIVATAIVLQGCATDDSIKDALSSEMGICFDSGTGAVTRAVKTGSEAATALNNSITVFGYKTETGGTKRTVFDYYTVQYIPGSAATGTANTANWQYAGLSMLDLDGTETGATQVTKYWDYAASQFEFIAFSKGTATGVTVSAIDNTEATPTYKLTGTTSELMKMYVADRVTATANAAVIANRQYPYGSPIQFNFSALGAKVRIGLYETIPGYSVRDVKFYVGTNTQSQSKPILTAASNVIPSGDGTVTVTFPETNASSPDYYNKVKTTFAGSMSNTVQFGDLVLKGREVSEQEGNYYLGREATSPALSGYTAVVPTDAGELTLKVDYTLVARDGDGETIAVEGVTATIPAAHTHWQSNYAYTYIFKITDNGLTPITFDALETQDASGVENTIEF